MKNKLKLDYLSSLLPQNVGNASRYSLCNSDNLQTIFSRTTLYFNSFYRPQRGLGIIYPQKQIKLHQLMLVVVVVLGFNVPPTAKVIRRRDQLIHSNSSLTAEEKKSPSTPTVAAEEVSFSILDFEQTAAT